MKTTTQIDLYQKVLIKNEPTDKPFLSDNVLSNEHEKPKPDENKMQVISDKITVKDEPYESLFSVYNKKDASLFIKTYNQILQKMGYTKPMTYRRYVQHDLVVYEIYSHRWCITDKDGKLKELDDKNFDRNKWKQAMREINMRLGKVYRLD